MQDAEMSKELLVGFRFQPTDIELIDHYLRRRLKEGSSRLLNCLIQECDIYKFEPWNLPCDSFRFRNDENEMYFFTPRHPSSGCPQRASRTAGKGYWKGYGKDKLVKMGTEVVGHKTALTYKVLNGKKESKTDWIMHEFRLQSSSTNGEDKIFDNLVLCRIHEKKKSREDTDGAGFIVEERQKKRIKVQEPEQECLVDGRGGQINTATCLIPQKCVGCHKVSDFLSDLVRKAPNLSVTDAGCANRSSKKRKAANESHNSDENTSRSESDTVTCNSNSGCTGQGGRRSGARHGDFVDERNCYVRSEVVAGTSMQLGDDDKLCDPHTFDEQLDATGKKEIVPDSKSRSGVSIDIDLNLPLDVDGNV